MHPKRDCKYLYFILFLDFFKKLIDRNVSMYLIKILCYWYQHQLMSVRWGCSISNVFNVANGVRQGGMLSPKLFNIYINELSNILNNSLSGGLLYVESALTTCYMKMTYASLAYPLQVCKNCYQSVMNIVLVILLHLMLRNLYACPSNVLLTNTVTTQLYF